MTDQLPSIADYSVAVSFVSTQGRHTPGVKVQNKFGPPIALCNDLSHITTELREIPVFSPTDDASILHMIS